MSSTTKLNTTTLQSRPYTDKVIGFAGATPLEIMLDASGKIEEVKLLPNKDTPAYVRIVTDAGLLKAWNGLTPAEALLKQVDAVTGATFTSQGIIRTMQKRMEVYEAQRSSSNTTLTVAGIGLAALLLAGLWFVKQRKRRRRLVA